MAQERNISVTRDPTDAEIFLSVVVPAYNEEKVLQEFHRRLANVLESVSGKTEIVYVNDGSTDSTIKLMEALREKSQTIAVVDLSSNFGKEIALSAGLDCAR